MKKLCAAFAAVFAVTAVLSGCGKTTSYTVYTNIPNGGYVITDKNYKTVQEIEGADYVLTEALPATGNFESFGETYYNVMDTSATLVISADFSAAATSKEKFEELKENVNKILKELDASLSVSNESSFVCAFNGADAGEVVEADAVAYEVLCEAKRMYEFTEGYYNPAIYYNVELYSFYNGADLPESADDLPSDEKIGKFKELYSHFGEVEPYEEEGRYFVRKPRAVAEIDGVSYSMKIDLGGIGKGYAVDKINALIDESGFEYGYFDFGTSSMALNKHYRNGKYSVGFRNPRAKLTGETYITVTASDECVSTSADDVRYYVLDGVRYCHIFDPSTGKPVNSGITSASIVGGSAIEGDALTTAIMAMGKDRAVEFIREKLSDRRVVFTCEG